MKQFAIIINIYSGVQSSIPVNPNWTRLDLLKYHSKLLVKSMKLIAVFKTKQNV